MDEVYARRQPTRWFLWLLVLLAAAAALTAASVRWHVESRNRSVEITLDYQEVRRLAAASGEPIERVLQRFRDVGVTSVALTEETVADLEDNRRIEVVPSSRPGASFFFIHQGNFQRVLQNLKARTHFEMRIPAGLDPRTTQDAGLRVNQPFPLVRGVGVGLDPAAIETIRQARLDVVGRAANFDGVTPDALAWVLNQFKEDGVRTVIFSRDEVLGYPALVAAAPGATDRITTASALTASGLQYGSVEFGKQKGDAALVRAAAARTVRVHTVTGEEMASADIPSNVQRFLLAARERNIRLLYVRLFLREAKPLDDNLQYVRSITRGLRHGGLATGRAHGYASLVPAFWVRALVGVGLAAAFLLLVDLITGLLVGGSVRGAVGSLLVAVAIGSLPMLPFGSLGIKAAALAAACLFPAIALVEQDLLAPALPRRGIWAPALARFLFASLISGIGVLYILGLLSDRLFLIKADAFVGIKVAQLVPLGIAALVYGMGLRASTAAEWNRRVADGARRLRSLAEQPVLFWQVAAGLAALAVLALLVMRSGNDPGIGVSDSEMRVRAVLDRLLYARPRFKEFLIGHPLLFAGICLGLRGRRDWAAALVIAGTIGQMSLVNTFCHLHTPLLVSLWRAGLGVVFGLGLGVVLAMVLAPQPEPIARRFVYAGGDQDLARANGFAGAAQDFLLAPARQENEPGEAPPDGRPPAAAGYRAGVEEVPLVPLPSEAGQTERVATATVVAVDVPEPIVLTALPARALDGAIDPEAEAAVSSEPTLEIEPVAEALAPPQTVSELDRTQELPAG